MLQLAIPYIDNQIDTLNIIVKAYGFSERQVHKEDVFPAYYKGRGEWEPIPWQTDNSLSYHRVTGDVTRSEFARPDPMQAMIEETTPLAFIAMFRVADLSVQPDDAYRAKRISDAIAQVLQQDNEPAFLTGIKAMNGKTVINSISINSLDIWNGEHENIEPRKDFGKYQLIKIEYDLVAVQSKDCWPIEVPS